MSRRESNSPPMSALAVAEAHFPDHVRKIQHLFHESEAFRSICEDLSVVVETLTHLDGVPPDDREMRRQEYEGLAEALVSELGEALSQWNVVSLRRSEETKPRSR